MIWREETACGCKLNLRLKVTAVRPDGLHELSTLFWPLDFPGDLLEAEEAAGLTVTVPGSPQLETADNLVARAAGIFAEAAGIAPAWHFTLHKRTPVAAGLGGGSADAAAALRLLDGRFGALDKQELARIASELGADVPFFLDPRPALGRGVGGDLEFVTATGELPLVLVNPGFPVSVKWAYRRFDLDGAEASDAGCDGVLAGLARGDLKLVAGNVRNDLAGALWRKFPVLTRIADELAARGALAVEVSGSGPTLFAVMPSAVLARRAAADLSERYPQWRSFAAEGRR